MDTVSWLPTPVHPPVDELTRLEDHQGHHHGLENRVIEMLAVLPGLAVLALAHSLVGLAQGGQHVVLARPHRQRLHSATSCRVLVEHHQLYPINP